MPGVLFNVGLCRLGGLANKLAIRSPKLHASAAFLSAAAAKKDTVRIGCSSGFWGDSAFASRQLINFGKVDFLCMDFLSEITMSLLYAAKMKRPEMGWVPDFVEYALGGKSLETIRQRKIRIVANAGGINVQSAVKAIRDYCAKAGHPDVKVAGVIGDDLTSRMAEIRDEGVKDIEGRPLPESITSATAYLGAFPIAEALNRGADIVITGRCVDSALCLGPLIHSFGWKPADYNLLASGSLAGHLIECGAQCTGGIFTDWDKVQGWESIGYPLVDVKADGSFTLTKPPQTGGLVTVDTAAEQMVYEIGDPQAYALPDVVCDFSQVKMKEAGKNVVAVSGAIGRPPSDVYKVCATAADGYRATAVCMLGGGLAIAKARKTAEAILARCRFIFSIAGLEDFTGTHIHVVPSEAQFGANANTELAEKSRDACLWVAVSHADKKGIGIFSRELASAGTSMAPGFSFLVGGRPAPAPIFRLVSFMYPKSKVNPLNITMSSDLFVKYEDATLSNSSSSSSSGDKAPESCEIPVATETGSYNYRIFDLARLRSGDKGDSCNIGVIARKPEFLPFLARELTVDAVFNYFRHVFPADAKDANKFVDRYYLPGINGFNFVLKSSLGGGGVASLRPDPQGKSYGQILGDFKVKNLPKLL